MTERDRVRVGRDTIEYEVKRSSRRWKTVQIKVVGGAVTVLSPDKLAARDIRDIVRLRAPWILSKLAEPEMGVATKRFVSGETMPYLGSDIEMVVKEADVTAAEVRLKHQLFHVTAPSGLSGDERFDSISLGFEYWYRYQAQKLLRRLVDRWARRLGHRRRIRMLIRGQRARWGSCSEDGTLRFSWRVMMVRPALVEIIVVHELAHLTHPNHSPEFWAMVASVIPDTDLRRRELSEAGKALPL